MAFTETLDVTTFDGYKGQVRYHCIFDGAAQDQTDTVLVDISALAPAPNHITLERVQAYVNGDFRVDLEFENTTDQLIRVFTGQTDVSNPDIVDFTGGPNKGVANTSAGGTGDLVYTTSGAAAGEEFDIVADFHKKN
jgi:hypothetical protein